MNPTALALATLDLDRAARITVAVVPALLLGYCAGRLRGDDRTRDDAVSEADVGRDADLALARDLDDRVASIRPTYEPIERDGA